MKLPPFEVHRPSSLSEASRLLRDLGDDAVPISGGTELLLAMKLGLAQYAHLIDLKRVPELCGVRRVGSGLAVGAGMTHRELEGSPLIAEAVAEMPRMLAEIANIRVRSVGTIGGNLCFADPHSDPATFLSAVEATLVLGDGATSRRVPVDQFLLGAYETMLEPGELLVEVTLPAVTDGTGTAHIRMKVHERPTVTVAAKVTVERGTVVRARLVVGSVCGTPALPQAVDKLIGAPRAAWSERVREVAALSAAAIVPVADAEGSSRYKQALVEVFVRRALDAALANAQGMTR